MDVEREIGKLIKPKELAKKLGIEYRFLLRNAKAHGAIRGEKSWLFYEKNVERALKVMP